jgi:hypothetical protein
VSAEEVADVAITPSIREFVLVLAQNPAIFEQFPDYKSLDTGRPLTSRQLYHAALVMQVVPELARLRFNLSPRVLTESQFWHIYFALVHRKVGTSLGETNEWLPLNPLRNDIEYRKTLVPFKVDIAIRHVSLVVCLSAAASCLRYPQTLCFLIFQERSHGGLLTTLNGISEDDDDARSHLFNSGVLDVDRRGVWKTLLQKNSPRTPTTLIDTWYKEANLRKAQVRFYGVVFTCLMNATDLPFFF